MNAERCTIFLKFETNEKEKSKFAMYFFKASYMYVPARIVGFGFDTF